MNTENIFPKFSSEVCNSIALAIARAAILDFTKKIVLDADEAEQLKESIIDSVIEVLQNN